MFGRGCRLVSGSPAETGAKGHPTNDLMSSNGLGERSAERPGRTVAEHLRREETAFANGLARWREAGALTLAEAAPGAR